MAIEMRIPKLGFSMDEGTIVDWLVADGDEVEQGQVVYALEAEKAVQEIEAPASGRIRILAASGESYPVTTVVAEIG